MHESFYMNYNKPEKNVDITIQNMHKLSDRLDCKDIGIVDNCQLNNMWLLKYKAHQC